MEISTKILWFFLVLCYCITAPSCRSLKKSIEANRESSEMKSESYTAVRRSFLDTTKTDFSELITYEFKIRKLELPELKDRSENQNHSAENIHDLIQIEGLLDRVTDLKIEIRRTEKQFKGISSDSVFSESKKQEQKHRSNNREVQVKSDSTLFANVPWYVWVIGLLFIIGMMRYFWKKIKS